jgi:hypothetical protein
MTRQQYFVLYFQVLQSMPGTKGVYKTAWVETEELVVNLTGFRRYRTYESFKVGKTRYFAHGEHI